VTFSLNNLSDTTSVVTTSDHAQVSDLEWYELGDLTSLKVDLNGVVDLDQWVGETNQTAIVGLDVWGGASTDTSLCDLCKLEGGLFLGDWVQDETTLGIVQETEVVVGLLDDYSIVETSWVFGVGAGLAVNFDSTVHQDGSDLLSGQSVLELISNQKNQGDTLSQLVFTSVWHSGEDTAHLVKHPVLWCVQALQVLFRSAWLHFVSTVLKVDAPATNHRKIIIHFKVLIKLCHIHNNPQQ